MAQRKVSEDTVLQYAHLLAQYVQAEGESELARLVAAMALARVAPTSVAHARVAAEALQPILVHRSDQLARRYEILPWVEQDVSGDICGALAVLNHSVTGSAVIPDLLRALDAADGFTALTIAEALLYIAFRQSGRAARVNMRDLTGDQIVVLEALANEHSPCWKINVNMAEILRSYGLPDWPDKLRAALASPSP